MPEEKLHVHKFVDRVIQPTLRDKAKGLWAKCKKPVILSLAAVLAVIVLIFAGVNFVIPQFHYSMGKQQLEKRNYEKAISHFMKCRDYRDSEEYLSGFVIFSDMEITETDESDTTSETERLIYTYNRFGDFWPGSNRFFQYDAHENPTVCVELDYYGKVASWSTYENTYNEQGVLIHVRVFETGLGKEHTLIEEQKYNDRGEQTELIYYTRGEISQHSYFDYDYTYDEKGRVRSAICYQHGDFQEENRYTYYGNGKVKEKTVHEKDGALSEVVKYYRNGEEKYRAYYYPDGNIRSEEKYYPNGDEKYTVGYYENGQIDYEIKRYRNGAEKNYYYGIDGSIQHKAIRKGNGKLTQINYDADGKKVRENKYDDHNRKVYQRIIEDGEKFTYRATRSYDRYGRATKEIITTQWTGDAKHRKETTLRYTDLEIRYMPHYIAEHPSGK